MTLIGDPLFLALPLTVALIAGVVKGVVGFAMPMILISGLSGIVPAEIALAGLILPTLLTNGIQALRQGPGEAWHSVRRFRLFLLCGMLALLASAQLVSFVSSRTLLTMIGAPVVFFAALQLFGVQVRLPTPPSRWIEAGIATVAGSIGGISGVWGPPTVMFLTALETEKREQMRIQGVIYGLGSLALMLAHIGSGVLNRDTLPFSLMLVPPAILGMWIGGRIQDRIDQRLFRRTTLLVLFIAGLNLLRRGLTG